MMKSLIFSMICLPVLFQACSSYQAQPSSDFHVILNWQTAPLPHPFNYSYKLQVGPQSQGHLVYRAEDDESGWQTSFTLAENALETLYQFLTTRHALRNHWEQGDPIDGASQTFIRIVNAGQVFNLPPVTELSYSDRELVNEIIEEINACVPVSIWKELQARQADYEEAYFKSDSQ